MSIRRTRRITAEAAENLLDGTGADPQHPLLAATLRAAAGPARPGELAGRDRALAAFHDARQDTVTRSRRPSMIKATLLKLLTVKAAAVAAVVVGTGGVALAASTGAIPNPLAGHATPAASASKSHPTGGPDATDHPNGNANPSPSVVGLCTAYTDNRSGHGKALESPAFQALVAAAGGNDSVDAFCAGILASAKPDPATGHPGGQPSNHPTDHPTGKPSDHPTARPSDHPTARPTDHPTGKPSTHPNQ